MATTNFESPEHALHAGMLLGEMMKKGIVAHPVVDEENDFTDVIILAFPDGLEVAVRVLPPEPKTS